MISFLKFLLLLVQITIEPFLNNLITGMKFQALRGVAAAEAEPRVL
jgi:hypothetical protein